MAPNVAFGLSSSTFFAFPSWLRVQHCWHWRPLFFPRSLSDQKSPQLCPNLVFFFSCFVFCFVFFSVAPSLSTVTSTRSRQSRRRMITAGAACILLWCCFFFGGSRPFKGLKGRSVWGFFQAWVTWSVGGAQCIQMPGVVGEAGGGEGYKDAQLLKTFRNISLKSSALASDQK